MRLFKYHVWILSMVLWQPTLSSASLFRVVIDPGHGGSDEGTVYEQGEFRIAEKDVTLNLARRVASQLQARGFSVTLTRDKDQEVPLPDRTALANRLKADVFISLHMNSTHNIDSGDAEGVETFILNNATDASSKRLAKLENTVISVQKPESPEQWDIALILKDLRLDGNLAESKRLACNVQSELVSATAVKSQGESRSRRNRGVKQALFHVLLGADMPSVLVEAGFLNSPRDRKFVLSSKGQMAMSHAIANAIDQYRKIKTSKKSSLALSRCKVN